MERNDEEFTRIFNEYYSPVCRFLEGMTGRRSLAQDLAQECFLRFYNARPREMPADEARFWLFRVARNLALNELSKGHTRGRLFDKVVEAFRPRALNPEQRLEQDERASLINGMLETLPEHQRTTLLLRETEEMSYREMAEVLGVSESKIKVDLFRARHALRAKWEEAAGCGGNARLQKEKIESGY